MSTLIVGTTGPLVEDLARGLCEGGESVELILATERRRPVSRELEELGRDGVSWLSGDPAAIDFGLTGAEYRALLERAGRVVLAFEPEPRDGDEVEKSRLVRAAAEVLEFVRSGGGREQVVHWSSLFVFGTARGRVREDELRVGQGFANRFEECHGVAERIVRHTSELTRLAVVRSAPLVGEATSGRLFEDSALGELVAAVERSPARSEILWEPRVARLETSERVARALTAAWRALRPVTAHLVDENAPSSRELLEWIGEARDREFVEPLPGTRPRARRTPFDELGTPEGRALAGWELHFERENALGLFPELLDPSARELVDGLLGARRAIVSGS